eukprot:TRINITY_DN757_c0_g1_i7.p1 TRINITY_DN757_c0_g1~~TRINITY_DN757_c0_g1_i7.p1  ORF type:complete len:101 (-),score=26.74 TRINITY_DN757_c0_g1_i7:37-339(-)
MLSCWWILFSIFFFFFFFKQKTAYEMLRSLVGSEMCIRDRCISRCDIQRGRVEGMGARKHALVLTLELTPPPCSGYIGIFPRHDYWSSDNVSSAKLEVVA